MGIDLILAIIALLSIVGNIILVLQLRQKYQQLSNTTQELTTAKTNHTLLEQQLQHLKGSTQQQSELQQAAITNAKAAIFEVGNKLSAELMRQSRNDNATQSKQQQEAFGKLQQQYQTQLQQIIAQVGSLQQQISKSSKTVEVVRRALLSPSGAGMLAEITLENILKNSNLIAGVDYILQPSYNSINSTNKIRPDAVVFTPGDNVILIDAKASKFFLELGEANTPEQKTIAEQQLLATMQRHLKALSSRSYQEAAQEYLPKGSKALAKSSSLLMFIPSESAIELLQQLNPKFLTSSWDQGIYPVGPAGLANILAQAHLMVTETKQAENYQQIIDEVKKLLTSVKQLQEHGGKLGNALRSVVNAYDKFAASFNGNFLVKSNKLQQMGVNQNDNKLKTHKLGRYQLIDNSTTQELDNVEYQAELVKDEQ